MSARKVIWVLSLVVMCFTSCSKDDEEVIVNEPAQYPMKTLIESGHMNVTYEKVDWVNTFELGFKFKSFKNGNITALGVRVPNNKSYRVTLWNLDNEEVLVTSYVQATSGLISFQDIQPIAINSGVSYFVSVNTNDYYQFSNGGNDLFPVESGDVLITGYGSYFGTSQMLPPTFSNTAYLGMVDIKFVENN